MKLTQRRLKEVLDYNFETGVFTWRKTLSARRQAGAIAGCIGNVYGYRLIGVDGKLYSASRLAWLYVTGEYPTNSVDHINRVRADDRFINLRHCTRSQNQQNRTLQTNNTSGYKGVSYHAQTKKWVARIIINKQKHYLGLFVSPIDASRAYKKTAKELHGEFANPV